MNGDKINAVINDRLGTLEDGTRRRLEGGFKAKTAKKPERDNAGNSAGGAGLSVNLLAKSNTLRGKNTETGTILHVTNQMSGDTRTDKDAIPNGRVVPNSRGLIGSGGGVDLGVKDEGNDNIAGIRSTGRSSPMEPELKRTNDLNGATGDHTTIAVDSITANRRAIEPVDILEGVTASGAIGIAEGQDRAIAQIGADGGGREKEIKILGLKTKKAAGAEISNSAQALA